MLRIQPVILEWIDAIRPILRALETRDRVLADQLARSAKAVYLSVAEGAGASGGRKRNSYRIALGEMRESVAALELAVHLHGLEPLGAHDVDRQSRVIGTLVRLAR